MMCLTECTGGVKWKFLARHEVSTTFYHCCLGHAQRLKVLRMASRLYAVNGRARCDVGSHLDPSDFWVAEHYSTLPHSTSTH